MRCWANPGEAASRAGKSSASANQPTTRLVVHPPGLRPRRDAREGCPGVGRHRAPALPVFPRHSPQHRRCHQPCVTWKVATGLDPKAREDCCRRTAATDTAPSICKVKHGTWGGEIRREFQPQPGEIVVLEHWGSSGFANTDLDLQLKKHGIHQLIVMGLIAHTCVEATVRYAADRGLLG